MRKATLLPFVLAVVLGCEAKALNVGSGTTSSGSGSATAWTGYFESYQMVYGASALSMNLSFNADGSVTGTTLFGGLPLVAPPTDPNVGYEVGIDGVNLEHFNFTVHDGRLDGQRLTFTLDPNELFAQWCALQTSYPIVMMDGGVDGYRCVPPGTFTQGGIADEAGADTSSCTIASSQLGTISVECGKMLLCEDLGVGEVCACTPSGCTEYVENGISFDMQVSGNHIDGSVVGLGTATPVTVHFTEGN